MGFLSKLFGGDAGAPPSKAAESSGSTPELESSVAVRVPSKAPEAADAPSKKGAPAPASTASSRRVEPSAVEPSAVEPPRSANDPALVPGSEVSLKAAVAPSSEAREPAKVAPKAPAGGADRTPPSSLGNPGAPLPPRKAGEPQRRPPQAESSIITSAPVLADGQRPPLAPRPAAAKPTKPALPADPNGPRERAPMSSLTGESGLLGSTRSRKDRSKSPGFYSNVGATNAADTVKPSLSQQNLRRTVVGVAPPPDLSGTAPLNGSAKATPELERGATGADVPGPDAPGPDAPGPDAPAPEVEASSSATSTVGAALDAGGTPKPANDAAPVPQAAYEVAAVIPSRAPVAPAGEGDEKEETAPGLGHTPSRHDPVLRAELPEVDLDLLVDFVMDLGLGLADEAWLGPVRDAIGRLAAAAVKLQRNGLEKALGQLRVEIDAPNALAEERKSRIIQQLVLVDLALPRPIDVPGQRLVRERLIVQHLLAELSASHPLIAQCLRDDGVLSLERASRLQPDELASRAGVSVDQADQALAVFKEYLAERARRGPQASLLGKRRVLDQRLIDLEASAGAFERLLDDDDAGAKREARKKRQSDIARIGLVLAECGEAVILGEIERSSVQGKIARLRRWLTELPPSSARAGVDLVRQGTTG